MLRVLQLVISRLLGRVVQSIRPFVRLCATLCPFHPFHDHLPVIRLQAPGQAPETSPGPVKSGQAKVKANQRAAGGSVRIRFLTEPASGRRNAHRQDWTLPRPTRKRTREKSSIWGASIPIRTDKKASIKGNQSLFPKSTRNYFTFYWTGLSCRALLTAMSNYITPEEFRSALIQEIKTSGLSRAEIAVATGYSVASLSKFIGGHTVPPMRSRKPTLDAIERAKKEIQQ